jgi:hypothetical protein
MMSDMEGSQSEFLALHEQTAGVQLALDELVVSANHERVTMRDLKECN